MDRDQETTYLAAVGHDGAGTLMAPITACGSDSEYPRVKLLSHEKSVIAVCVCTVGVQEGYSEDTVGVQEGYSGGTGGVQ